MLGKECFGVLWGKSPNLGWEMGWSYDTLAWSDGHWKPQVDSQQQDEPEKAIGTKHRRDVESPLVILVRPLVDAEQTATRLRTKPLILAQ